MESNLSRRNMLTEILASYPIVVGDVKPGGEVAFVDLFARLGGWHLPFFYQTESTLRRSNSFIDF